LDQLELVVREANLVSKGQLDHKALLVQTDNLEALDNKDRGDNRVHLDLLDQLDL
jgi:hypothetical protein